MSIACWASPEEFTDPDSSTDAPDERTSNRPVGML